MMITRLYEVDGLIIHDANSLRHAVLYVWHSYDGRALSAILGPTTDDYACTTSLL